MIRSCYRKTRLICMAALAWASLLLLNGCYLQEWVHNGFKVGPAYHEPVAPVASAWIDYGDGHVSSAPADLSEWWQVLNDPVLNSLIEQSYRDNLTLKSAGTRIMQAAAVRGIAVGNLFPQLQQATGDYAARKFSERTAFVPPRVWAQEWSGGFTASWELDFWGRFRRAIEAADANLDASVANYDNVLVILLANVASAYVQLRTAQERLAFARDNARIQTDSLRIVEDRQRLGAATRRDVEQSKQILAQTEARIPPLEASIAQAGNQLCILLGIPPENLLPQLGDGKVPSSPPEVALGIPADLIRRRPDVRQAERLAAAQSAQIGVATADFYPRIAINGIIDVQAEQFKDLFDTPASMFGSIGPGVRWDILNYGRILNNVRAQDALFQQLVLDYQQQVLTAGQESEDAIVGYLKAIQQTRKLEESARAAAETYRISFEQWREGATDFTTVYLFESVMTDQQDQLASARGNIVLNLIAIYRALGGGWEMRFHRDPACHGPAATQAGVIVPADAAPAADPSNTLPRPNPIAN
jgi:NodT family efflux transporter outer membrane factor (OMF) lipoprotein